MSESEVRGWIIAICTLAQFVLAVFAVLYINYIWVGKNRKKDREKDRLKSDRNKIAAVLSKNYDKVETIHNDLKSELEKLKNIVIIVKDGGRGNITEFDVLEYMCRPDNRKRFQQTADARMADERIACSQIEFISPFKAFPPNSVCEQAIERGLSSVLSDVDEIMMFFYELRLTLSTSLHKECPDDLKEEFGKEITAMLETIRPFVETTSNRRKVINLVREYFKQPENAQESQASPTPVVQNRQSRGLNDVAIPLLQENQPDPDSPGQNGTSSGNQPEPDPIRDAIPYIESLWYKNGKIRCDIKVFKCDFSSIATLFSSYEDSQPTITVRENEILEKIKEFFPAEYQPISNNLRHEIRKIMFNLSQSPNSEFKSACLKLDKYIKGIVNAPENRNVEEEVFRSKRALGIMKACINHLYSKDYRLLLSKPDTRAKLEAILKDLQTLSESDAE